MKYRIINKRCGDRAEANRICKSLQDKVHAPYVFHSESTGAWLVVLYDADRMSLAQKAQAHYMEIGLKAFIQIY